MSKAKNNELKKGSKKEFKNDSSALILTSLLITSIILMLSFVNLFPKSKMPSEINVLAAKHQDLTQSKVYWENFLQENPGYTSGWLELSKIYSEIGYTIGAIKALETANRLDPNSELVKETKILLGL